MYRERLKEEMEAKANIKHVIIGGWKAERKDGNIILTNTHPKDWSGALLTPKEESIEGSLLHRLLDDALKEAGI